ncbi:arsenate reductase (glutaredoxin) [Roseococcus sp. DSY-14]|uniref:arsenate reductase (glutaredoxin) n=1 Tax=Roseococcus sp. DSY-14 TaxID=3369650 RepID=UPI00387B3118
MSVTIWHNPACGTSRNVLAMIRNSGEEPVIRDYLRQPPDAAALRDALARTGLPARALLRRKGAPFAELGLDDPALDEEALIAAMLAHPILIERPLVFTARGARLCRPSEVVLEILEQPQRAPFSKEDGTPVHG